MEKRPATLNIAIVGQDDPRPEPPERPLPSDCCDSGCDPCVHDSYSDELQHYREQLAKWLQRHPEGAGDQPSGPPRPGDPSPGGSR